MKTKDEKLDILARHISTPARMNENNNSVKKLYSILKLCDNIVLWINIFYNKTKN